MLSNDVILILAWIGGISIYVAAGGLTGSLVYKALKKKSDESSAVVLAALMGIFWPIAVPFGFIIGSVYRLVAGLVFAGSGKDLSVTSSCEDNKKEDSNDDEEDDEEEEEDECKFKVGDLITGVSGNPGNYNHLYEGCVCRVLEIDGNEMKVILIDHKDKEAHKDNIGETFEEADPENFKLIPKKRPLRAKKPVKKPIKRKAVKRR